MSITEHLSLMFLFFVLYTFRTNRNYEIKMKTRYYKLYVLHVTFLFLLLSITILLLLPLLLFCMVILSRSVPIVQWQINKQMGTEATG